MKIFEIVKQSGRSIRSSKLRSGLTLLAISVGVFAIISATTAVKVLDTYFKETMAIMGGDVITLTRFPTVNIGNTDWEFYRNRDRITFDQMESREVGRIENFATTRVFYGTEQTEPNVELQGANIHYVSNNAYNIAEGRNFLQEDVDNARRLAIIGADLLPVLFENVNPLGKEIRVDGYKYTIIGVTEAKGQIFGNTMDRFVMIPYTTARTVYGQNRDIAIQLKAGSVENVQRMI
ncbi:MAG: ABC transporter permease, partial [Balneolaceae bacterium]